MKVALREKAVASDSEVSGSFGDGRTDDPFVAANPRAALPVLVGGEPALLEPIVIIESIEERWPAPPLLERDPVARARARMIETVCDSQYEAVN